MNATRQRATEIEFAEKMVQLGACHHDLEAALRDAEQARRDLIRLLAILGGKPGPDFVSDAA